MTSLHSTNPLTKNPEIDTAFHNLQLHLEQTDKYLNLDAVRAIRFVLDNRSLFDSDYRHNQTNWDMGRMKRECLAHINTLRSTKNINHVELQSNVEELLEVLLTKLF